MSSPVVVLKVRPVGAAGEIEYEEIAPPEDEMVYPDIAVSTTLLSEDGERVKAGTAIGVTVCVGFPQSAGRLDNKSIKLLKGEYSTAAELIIFPLFVLTETEKL